MAARNWFRAALWQEPCTMQVIGTEAEIDKVLDLVHQVRPAWDLAVARKFFTGFGADITLSKKIAPDETLTVKITLTPGQ